MRQIFFRSCTVLKRLKKSAHLRLFRHFVRHIAIFRWPQSFQFHSITAGSRWLTTGTDKFHQLNQLALSIFDFLASKNGYFKHRKVVFKGRKMWFNLQLSDSMFRSSRVLQITALLALSFGAGTLLFLTARYWKRKRREPSTGNSSSYNDRPLRRKRTLTSGNKQSGVRFVLKCVYIKQFIIISL